ncbi:MAG: hypothetical protein HXX16_15860 [Bacteroidales bacterium]|nr:hypothetical protein [Bacteroidales bacterium]
MKRFFVVLILAAIFALIALYFIKPEIVEKIWLWVVGLLGTIIAFFQRTFKWVGDKIDNLTHKNTNNTQTGIIANCDYFMQIVRYSRTGNRILGMVFIDGKFIGISNENAQNSLGIYQLNIKNNTITLSNQSVTLSLIPLANNSSNEQDILFSADQNAQNTDTNQAYNSIIEQLSAVLEKDMKPSLQVSNSDIFQKNQQ